MYKISIKFNDQQKEAIIHAIHNETPLTLSISGSQITPNNDFILVTKNQAAMLWKSVSDKNIVHIKFTIKQIQQMKQQIGNGILDSIGGLFKSGFNKVQSYFSKKPVNIEMKTIPKTKNVKAQQFFNDAETNPGKYKPKPIFTPSESYRMQQIQKLPDVQPLNPANIPKVINPTPPKLSSFDVGYNNDKPFPTKIKNPPMTAKDHAIAQWKMQKNGYNKPNVFDKMGNALDTLHNKYTDLTF